MATTTTNFGWDIPQSTDLVKDGATAIAALGQDIDTALIDLKGGTTGQVLAKASNADLDYSWVAQDDSNAIQNAIVDAKGDLIAATANDTPARLGVGSNGQILTADSTTATGLAWATPSSGGGMTSIASGSLSGSSLSLTSISGSYKNLQLVLRDVTPSATTAVRLRINNNTSTIYDRLYIVGANDTFLNAMNQAQTSITASYNNVSTAAGKAWIMNFYDYAKTTSYKQIDVFGSYSYPNGQEVYVANAQARDANAVTRIDVILDSGSFSAGTYILYGVN